MAGQRKAEYVSIPLGPGLLTNTTGRGAKTRINYMNWDRWKDASWVRWHKLLAEMCGGWAFVPLEPPPSNTALVPVILALTAGTGSGSIIGFDLFTAVGSLTPGSFTGNDSVSHTISDLADDGTPAHNFQLQLVSAVGGQNAVFASVQFTDENGNSHTFNSQDATFTGGTTWSWAQPDGQMFVSGHSYNITINFTPATATYAGVARALKDWASIDGQFWVAIGTHLKLYVVNNGVLYDITPIRATSNVNNAIQTTNGSNIVLITDAGHKANTGDFVDISGASAVGGLTIAGSYEVVVLDPNTYHIIAASNATSGATGGGSMSIAYEIYTGLGGNGELLGYGTGEYGIGTYGTPRAFGTGVQARMRTWSLDNFGQDLIASESDGEIYIWERNSGPNSRATLVPNAPLGVQRTIVDAAQRVVIALGCTDVTSNFDAMLVRWCDFEDITTWFPESTNTAGDYELSAGSRIVTGIKTKGQNLIFTDTQLYRMVFVGGTDIYDFVPAGNVNIVGPNAAVDVDGVAYAMGYSNFYNYSGTLNLLACDCWETVFDPNVPTSINPAQAEATFCFTYEPKTEITWLYQSISANRFNTAFTGGLGVGAISGTLASAWDFPTGFYDMQFADQSSRPVFLTNGQTTATWSLPLVSAVGADIVFIGNDRYVTYNWEDGVFYAGDWQRTAAQGFAPAMGKLPYGVNGGFLYQHEVGTDAIEAFGTFAIPFFMESLDITTGGAKSEYTMGGSDARFAIGGSDSHLRVVSMLPDWAYFSGSMNIYLKTKDRPQDSTYVVNGPVAFNFATGQVDIDAHGSQIVIRFDNLTEPNNQPGLGVRFRMGIWQGLATPYAKR